MTQSHTLEMPAQKAHQALRAAFVARLVRRMKQTGVMSALFSALFGRDAVVVSPPHPCASGVHAILKPLCRSGVAAGGAGGGGPGSTRNLIVSRIFAATVEPLAA